MDRLSVTEIPEPPTPLDIPHKILMVATSPTAPSPVLPDILKIARTDGAKVLVVTVLEVPLALPLSAPLPAEEQAARHTLSVCQAIGVERDVLVDTRLLRGRSAGEALVRTLRREQADTLVINDTDSPVSRAIETVLLRSGLPVTLWKFRRLGPEASREHAPSA